MERFQGHEQLKFHQNSKFKWFARERPIITAQLCAQTAEGLLQQLAAIQLLTPKASQYVATENSGNLYQLMLLQSENSEDARTWIKDNHFTSDEAVTEQIIILGQTLLQNIITLIREVII